MFVILIVIPCLRSSSLLDTLDWKADEDPGFPPLNE